MPALTYLYGTTSHGDYEVHHGEDFVNPSGVSVLAVGNGTIIVAGNDSARMCGDDGKQPCGRDINFFGNVIVLQLDRDFNRQRVFALYGHLSKINVKEGDRVKTGDVLGEVGMTGVAIGPHVHFEICLGVNDYAHTRNPILWMTPLPGRGALVGRYLDSTGKPIPGALVDLYRADDAFLLETETYSRDRYPAVNADDDLRENFAVSDLPAGDYIVRVKGQPLAQRVTVQEGKSSLIEIGGL